MHKKLIVANWKLNPATAAQAQKLAEGVSRRTRHVAVLCPPHVLLSSVRFPRLGAQDCFWTDHGPYTGQVSVLQLKKLKVKYCIVGHSERRATGDSDAMVSAKVVSLLEHGLTPILCVGYGTTQEEDDLAVVDVIRDQLKASLGRADPAKVVVAYEPVWAISAGSSIGHKTPTPEHAETVALFIKSRFGVSRVLYGGSANIVNAGAFLGQPNVDGLLVGADSLIAAHFNQMLNTA